MIERLDPAGQARGVAAGADPGAVAPRPIRAPADPIPPGRRPADRALYAQVRAGDEVLCTLRLGTRPAAIRHVAHAPYPNPSDLGAQWRVDLADPVDATFEVLDVAGRVVHGPERRRLQSGRNDLGWDGRRDGAAAPAGAYFLRLSGPGVALRSKLVLLPR